MALAAVYQGDVVVNGTISANTNIPSDGSVTNDKVSGTASNPIEADKLEFIRPPIAIDFGVGASTAPSGDVETVVYRARGPATIKSFDGLMIDCGTTTNVTYDLKKIPAGSTTQTSILSSPIAFTHSDTDNTAKAGTISNTALVAGDVLVAVMDYTSATGAKGPVVFLEVYEAAN